MADVKVFDLIDEVTLKTLCEGIAKLTGVDISVEADDEASTFLDKLAKIVSASVNEEALVSVNSVMAKIAEAEFAVQDSIKRVSTLVKTFDNISKLAENTASEVASTTGTVKVIQDIAMNTKILGFNASIEASRAKESGKGFGVIAQEVRNLAETSKASADKIEKTMQHIGEYSNSMNEQVANTKAIVDKSLNDLNSFSDFLEEIKAAE